MRGNNIRRWPLRTLRQRSGPRVGIDIDGVLRDIDEPIRKYLKRNYPEAELIDDTQWGFSQKYSNVPDDIEHEVFYDNSDEIFLDAQPYPQAREFFLDIDRLAKRYGGRAVLVTKQNDNSAMSTYRWLANTNIPADAVYIVRSPESKTIAECDILIDDSLKNLNEQEKAYGGAICVAHPWNESWGGTRFTHYDQIVDEVYKQLELGQRLNREFNRLTVNEKIKAILA